jgi:hypothetical protein
MTATDYIDTKGYWISPEDRSIRRMGDEGLGWVRPERSPQLAGTQSKPPLGST